jgi:hypothetical protein
MEAYINGRIKRLFQMRDAWLRSSGQTLTYHTAQTRAWEQRTAQRFSEIAREVMGVYALLDQQDPRAPAKGNFEFQQRKALALQGPNGAAEGHSGLTAQALGSGQPNEGTWEEPARRAFPTAPGPIGMASAGRGA